VLSGKMINGDVTIDGMRIGKGNCYCIIYLIFY
jgi:hypothetical protein